MKLRNVCFTLNNYFDQQYQEILNLTCGYVIVGREVGESGTPHIQGYIEFPNAVHFNSLRKKLFNSHIEKRSGTALQASDYCKKEGTFEMRGTITPGQGERTEIDAGVEMIQDANTMAEIAKAMPSVFIKFNKGFKVLKCALVEPRNEVPLVQVFWGPTGTGKSHGARTVFKEDDYADPPGTAPRREPRPTRRPPA